MVICDVQVGALENFRKQSHIEIIKLQHTVDEHSLSNLETVYDLGAKMVEALGKDKGALGVVFARVIDLENAHGMAAMVRRNLHQRHHIVLKDSRMFIVLGKVTWVSAKEVPGWTPDFADDNDDDNNTDNESYEGEPNGDDLKNAIELAEDSDLEVVPDSKLNEEPLNINVEEASVGQKDAPSEDPFNLYDLLNKKKVWGHPNKQTSDCSQNIQEEYAALRHNKSGSKENFKDDVAESICSGRILCVWDPKSFIKLNSTVSDYFVMVRGDWVPNGEVVVMGDFNEVRKKEERFGSLLNVQGADAFNLFISNAGLKEVSLGGCSYTWCHKSATKMSKLDRFLISESLMNSCPYISAITLDRYLSDHRPILMRESHHDYGPVPFRSLQELEKLQSLEAAQKANIKWVIEGDENSKYYHGILNKKRSIRGILVDEARLHLDINFPNMLNSDQLADLERKVIKDEIKRAVWDCGSDKSPGPDGFTFGFYRRYWKIIENEVVDAVTCFFHHGSFPKGSNSSFIALIPKTSDANMVKDFRPIILIGSMYKIIAKILTNRLVFVLGDLVNEIQLQILDGPFIMNDIIQWCQSKKKQSLVFKVDFKKAFDSVRWDYLDDVLSMFKGIMLSPFLHLSHLFYADDAIFMGQWNESNLNTIVHVLDCFHRASGLRINMSKSKLMGISVDIEKVVQAAKMIRCVTFTTPFTYLWSKVGGVRLTLLKSVLESMPIYHMSLFKVPMMILNRMESIRSHFFNGSYMLGKKPTWVKWKNALASKDKGGLGISSLFALNRALIFKWVWRFLYQNSSLWASVIKSIHGAQGKIGKEVNASFPSIWLNIVKEVDLLKNRYLYPRAYALESCKSIDVASKLSHNNLAYSFRRVPRGGAKQEQLDLLKAKITGMVDVEADLRGPVGLNKWASIFVNVRFNSDPSEVLLLRHGTSDSGPDMSFDTSASPVYMSGLGCASFGKDFLFSFFESEAFMVLFLLHSFFFFYSFFAVDGPWPLMGPDVSGSQQRLL
ncbi:RNA-directed DNA polymerase, eukaryota [Tanacetum coccineum]|uniref:RNA-directed DNA polymerase, eukaryota n=1 Tax=Tanacetum coccineum TaxID=301880 RepID=A0ABQ5EQ83_9ASTR